MDWFQAISTGGAWTIGTIVILALFRGDLRLGREVTERETTIQRHVAKIEKLEADVSTLVAEVRSVSDQAAEAMRVEHEATRREMAELAKTNTTLISMIADRRSA